MQQSLLFTIACVLSTGVWIAVGLYKITHREKMTNVIREHGIPAPHIALWASVFVELFGAVLLASQQYVWLALIAWLLFLLVATPIFHGAVICDGVIDYKQLVQFSKNISIAGGLIALLAMDGTVPRFLGWQQASALHEQVASHTRTKD